MKLGRAAAIRCMVLFICLDSLCYQGEQRLLPIGRSESNRLQGSVKGFTKASWLHLNIGYPAVGGSSLNPISSAENSGGVQRIAKSAVKEGRNSIRWEWYPKIIQ